MNKVCIAKLPNAGLGNKMFVWAQACVFAHKHGLPLYVTGWVQVPFKRILRRLAGREKSLRIYNRYFKPEPLERHIRCQWLVRTGNYIPVSSQDFQAQRIISTTRAAYLFSEVPHWLDCFCELKTQRAKLIEDFWAYTQPHIRDRVTAYHAPVIAVHIRMGDFRQLAAHENFAQVGGVRTPLQYFTDLIGQIRQTAQYTLPVTVFSDGNPDELASVLALPEVQLMPDDFDLVHLLVMSRAKIIIGSAGSSFSQWAMFLAEGAVALHHHEHNHTRVRDAAHNAAYYEGAAEGMPEHWDTLLRENIVKIAAALRTTLSV